MRHAGIRISVAIAVTFLCGEFFTACAPSIEQSESAVHAEIAKRITQQIDWRVRQSSAEEYSHWLCEALSGDLDADTAVAVALLNNRKLRALYGDLGVSRADLIDAGLPNNPVFSFERRFRGESLELDVAQDFLSVFLIPLRRTVAESEFNATKERVAGEILNHAFETRSAFYTAQAAELMAEMRRSIVAAAEASFDAAQKLQNAGNISKLELSQEARSVNDAQLELRRAENEIVSTRERLNVLLGLSGDLINWKISSRLPDIPTDDFQIGELEEAALQQRLDLAAARSDLSALASSAGITDIEALLTGLTLTSHFEREPEGKDSVGPSIEFPIPIFNWGTGARARMEAKLQRAENNYAALAIEIRSQVRTAFAKMNAAKKQAEYYRQEVLPVQQAMLEETQRQYNGMFVGMFQLIQARQLQVNAGGAYVESLRDFWLARTELEHALGSALPRQKGAEDGST